MFSGVAPFSPAFKLPFRLPWMLDTALLCIVFYAAGTVLGKKRFIVEKDAFSPSGLLAAALTGCVLSIALAVIFPAPINLSELELPNPVQFYCMSIAGIVGTSALAMRFPAAWLCMLGRNSLTIMCVHDPLKRLVIKGASLLSGMDVLALRQGPVSIIAMTAVTLMLSMMLTILINRYFPWMSKGVPLPTFFQQRT
jgi:fucose 4-O-acetylase-like acetyltransferase